MPFCACMVIETVVPQFNDGQPSLPPGPRPVFIVFAAIPPESIRRLLALHRAGICGS